MFVFRRIIVFYPINASFHIGLFLHLTLHSIQSLSVTRPQNKTASSSESGLMLWSRLTLESKDNCIDYCSLESGCHFSRSPLLLGYVRWPVALFAFFLTTSASYARLTD
ncbi:hypothetical protein P153DRAFT_1804 [Dothidotthia symphoricarpi CBS 119687]|uniref:Uncharacterized protein n=1 Tax=Dothidotthia symphoricarpi CBS 119687 TaxID=1392245 RepID=A0A6A6AUC2_9PLEO|nr:uncharacterized protein P153DRAFT_1804 [Dothidotthia symphoricarpi CBS 119687]KAF2134447.1 hypothetical protein P153DRAFT_1804 [Dothidotthia symphoricarpi CBS 119687]